MENSVASQDSQLIGLLKERVQANRVDLIDRYRRVLQEGLFTNRALVRPTILKQAAADEAEALLNYLSKAEYSGTDRGEKLQQAGFSIGAVLKLSQVTRQFLLDHLDNHQVAVMLETVDAYQQNVIEGFIQTIEKEHRIELEQTRNALQRDAG